jgi:hypothetical protein
MSRPLPLTAPAGLLPLPRPLMTGEVLDAAFRLFRAALLRCLPYSGLAVLVLELPTLYSTFQGGGTSLPFQMSVPLSGSIQIFGVTDGHLVLLVSLLLDVALFGMITLRLSSISRGVRPSFRAEIVRTLSRWPSACVATFAALIFPALVYTAISLFNPLFPNPLLPMVAVPMLFPSALFAVALPAFWCDGLGAFAAIARSLRISRRRWWRMVGAVLATFSLVAVFYVLATIVVALMAPILGRADLFLTATVQSVLTLVVGAFGVPFVLAMLVVAYEDLKLREQERRGAPR